MCTILPFWPSVIQVYVAELMADAHACAKRNSHNRTFEEINKVCREKFNMSFWWINCVILPLVPVGRVWEFSNLTPPNSKQYSVSFFEWEIMLLNWREIPVRKILPGSVFSMFCDQSLWTKSKACVQRTRSVFSECGLNEQGQETFGLFGSVVLMFLFTVNLV